MIVVARKVTQKVTRKVASKVTWALRLGAASCTVLSVGFGIEARAQSAPAQTAQAGSPSSGASLPAVTIEAPQRQVQQRSSSRATRSARAARSKLATGRSGASPSATSSPGAVGARTRTAESPWGHVDGLRRDPWRIGHENGYAPDRNAGRHFRHYARSDPGAGRAKHPGGGAIYFGRESGDRGCRHAF